jgi:hypothetical protein
VCDHPVEEPSVTAADLAAASQFGRVAGDARKPLVSAASTCRAAERALQDRAAPRPEPVTITATGDAQLVADWISRTLREIRETLAGTGRSAGPPSPQAARSTRVVGVDLS